MVDDDALDTLIAKLAATPQRRAPMGLVGTKRFEPQRRLGGGAFGDVYEARDREHGTLVALKSLRSSDPDWVYRFKREFRIVTDLVHPNLVRLYELFCETDRWHLTMELIDGLRFDEYVQRVPERLRSCLAQLASAVVALHRAGCLHRDLKPSNALVEATGRVVLLDFGLTVPRGSVHTSVAGTPAYMAPELAMGDEPTAASDWYAFGVMLFQLLAGALPYEGNDAEMLAAKLAGQPRVPPGFGAAAPDLAGLALRLVAAVPSQRPRQEEILAVLAGHGPVGAVAALAEPELAGRGRELARLEAAFGAAAAGQPRIVTVHGEPGIGKTSLVVAFLERIARPGVQIYRGRCHESESVPYKGIDAALDMLCSELGRRSDGELARLLPRGSGALAQMFPVLKRIDAFARAQRVEGRLRSPHEIRQAGSDALRELVHRLASAAPFVLFLDDLQWASDDGARLLRELVAAPAPPALVIAAYRRDAIGRNRVLDRLLAAFDGRPERIDLALEPLDAQGVAELLALRGEARWSVEEALRDTGGHPYLLSRALQGGERAPGELASVLALELAALTPAARALVETVAIAGGPIGTGVAFAAAGIAREPATLDALRRHRLLRVDPEGRLEAYHDRVRETALGGLSPVRRRDLHGRLARALETGGVGEPDALARHFREAGLADEALVWTRRAARAATTALAFERAAELYGEACALELADDARVRLLEDLAGAQVQAGRRDAAGQTCLEAAALAGRRGDLDAAGALRARAGEHFLLAGQLEHGIQLLRDALVEVGVVMPESPAVAVAYSFNAGGVLATRGLAFTRRRVAEIPAAILRRVDLELEVTRALMLADVRAPVIATNALLDALDAGEPRRVQLAMAYYVVALTGRAPDDPVVEAAEAHARALAEELDDELGLAWIELATGLRATQRSAFATALASLRRAEQRFVGLGPAHAREAASSRIAILVVCGSYGVDLPYARRHYAQTIAEAAARGDSFAGTWAEVTCCWSELAGGHPEVARAALAHAVAVWPRSTDSLFSATSLLNEVAVALYADPAGSWAAVERLEPEFSQLFSSMIPFPRAAFARLAANCAMAAFAAGRADRVETLRRLEPLVERTSVEHRPYDHWVGLSHLRLLAGDRAGAGRLLAQAAQFWGRAGQRGQELATRLRICQLAGDAVGADAAAAGLRDLAVVDPDRFATLFAGPRWP